MPMLVIFTNIISHPIARDQLINLRNVGTDETSLIPLAIQTRIANQCELLINVVLNTSTNETSLIPLAIQTRIANQCELQINVALNAGTIGTSFIPLAIQTRIAK